MHFTHEKKNHDFFQYRRALFRERQKLTKNILKIKFQISKNTKNKTKTTHKTKETKKAEAEMSVYRDKNTPIFEHITERELYSQLKREKFLGQ